MEHVFTALSETKHLGNVELVDHSSQERKVQNLPQPSQRTLAFLCCSLALWGVEKAKQLIFGTALMLWNFVIFLASMIWELIVTMMLSFIEATIIYTLEISFLIGFGYLIYCCLT